MAEESRVYKGAKLVVRVPNGESAGLGEELAEVTGLYIDGQFIPTTASRATGRYWTYMLPYQEFDSLMSLGEAVVDHVHGRAAEPEQHR